VNVFLALFCLSVLISGCIWFIDDVKRCCHEAMLDELWNEEDAQASWTAEV
jgi:hypothetical protein